MKHYVIRFFGALFACMGLTRWAHGVDGTCDYFYFVEASGSMVDSMTTERATYTAKTGVTTWYVGWPNENYTGSAKFWRISSVASRFVMPTTFDGDSYYLPTGRFSDSRLDTYCYLPSTGIYTYNARLHTPAVSVKPGCMLDTRKYTMYAFDPNLFSYFGCHLVSGTSMIGGSGTGGSGIGDSGYSSISTDDWPCFYSSASESGVYSYDGYSLRVNEVQEDKITYCFQGCGIGTYLEVISGQDRTVSLPQISVESALAGTTGCFDLYLAPGMLAGVGDVKGLPPCSLPGGNGGFSGYFCYEAGCTNYTAYPMEYFPGKCASCPWPDTSNFSADKVQVVFTSGGGLKKDCSASISVTDSKGTMVYNCGQYGQ